MWWEGGDGMGWDGGGMERGEFLSGDRSGRKERVFSSGTGQVNQ